MYSIEQLCEKIRTARLYRGFKSQSKISQKLGIPKQSWNLWERGARIPGMNNVVDICNFLNISPLFFFSQEPDIIGFDDKYNAGEAFSLPFVETEIVERIFRFLDNAMLKSGIYLIETPGEIGVSRGIFEWTRKRRRHNLLIFDHASDMPYQEILHHIQTTPNKPKAFICKPGVHPPLRNLPLSDSLKFEMIGYRDFIKIIQTALPGVSPAMVTLLLTHTGYSLKKLSMLIKRIAQKRRNSNWHLNFDSVMEICESLKKNNI